MFTDYYLKFADKAEADSVLYTEVPIAWDNSDPENSVVTETEQRPNYRNIDVLPTVVATQGTYDEEGNELTAPTYVDGYHVNVRALEGEDGSALEAYAVNPAPNTPARVWA
jgi:hypothetical protein